MFLLLKELEKRHSGLISDDLGILIAIAVDMFTKQLQTSLPPIPLVFVNVYSSQCLIALTGVLWKTSCGFTWTRKSMACPKSWTFMVTGIIISV